MSTAVAKLEAALERGAAIRPAVCGFPHYAAALRDGGVRRYRVSVPSSAFLYETAAGAVLIQREPIAVGTAEVAPFDEAAVVAAIRADQAGDVAFADFMAAIWAAGVVGYEADVEACTCTYHGADGATYVESFPAVSLAATA